MKRHALTLIFALLALSFGIANFCLRGNNARLVNQGFEMLDTVNAQQKLIDSLTEEISMHAWLDTVDGGVWKGK